MFWVQIVFAGLVNYTNLTVPRAGFVGKGLVNLA